ncbi:hypothetical protein WUBG_10065 [Wuchereria bancrofti]|uniref:Uncharacterized protein n=1 Tax=Wuchereria bancrofti TaxID=6293 RepID=J9E9L8_WUCBA|nr:hypothetical protein WUBG_10065 [Wuchereria bancrofti]VDM09102.1 unnamed protein product [Wuchereria bancrofti]
MTLHVLSCSCLFHNLTSQFQSLHHLICTLRVQSSPSSRSFAAYSFRFSNEMTLSHQTVTKSLLHLQLGRRMIYERIHPFSMVSQKFRGVKRLITHNNLETDNIWFISYGCDSCVFASN